MSPAAEEQTRLQRLAEQIGVVQEEVIECLAEGVRTRVPEEDFPALWKEIRSWRSVILTFRNRGLVVETGGKLPAGRIEKETLLFEQKGTRTSGCIALKEIGSVWLVSSPFHGLDNRSVQVFDRTGGPLLSIYVGRDRYGQLLETEKESFDWLRSCYLGKGPSGPSAKR